MLICRHQRSTQPGTHLQSTLPHVVLWIMEHTEPQITPHSTQNQKHIGSHPHLQQVRLEVLPVVKAGHSPSRAILL